MGIDVSPDLLNRWRNIFVFPDEPVFFTETSLELGKDLQPQPRTRRGDLNYADAYQTYHVGAHASHLACCLPEAIRHHAHHNKIMQVQHELGRGQIYTLAWVEQLFGSLPAPLIQDVFETSQGKHVALRHDAWHNLTPEEQNIWMSACIEQDRESCLSSTLPEALWEKIALHCGPHVRALAGTFSAESGPNCLATTLAPLLHGQAEVSEVQNTWLHPEPFLSGLHAAGFHPTETPPEFPDPCSVLVFLDPKGNLQHACLYLAEGLVLNKDAQGWFTPRQVRTLDSILKSWLHPGWTLQAYRKAERA
ncbi:hypothetical protein DC3_45260 [Deinococcus cellulosilyticus NBRC 106333 = KACC 11606]|uniref:Uncharacterized protein n=2 Tax=Deinococcus cellulosilyticus TaxID=401558 RepID=A0A511N930_DEIC1|nr:hypothetical protein DC3_45260 [Deinococcus cellulosilyticus NBRC 106333 = KACC 11606]